MKIGLVLPSSSGYSETFFYNKIKGLRANGHKVVLFVNSKTKSEFYDDIKVKVAPKLTGSLFSVIWVSFCSLVYSLLFHFNVCLRLFLNNRADGITVIQNFKSIIINSHILSESLDWLHFGYGTMALGREHVADALGAKMAVSFRGFDIGIYPIKHPACYKRLWPQVDKIHVISDDIAKLVHQHGFKNQAPIVKITPAIDVTQFQISYRTKTSDQLHFVTVARLHWKKGLDYTLEALSLLKQSGYSFTYTVIGDGEAYEYLKFTVQQLDLDAEVVFTGRVTHENVISLLSEGDIYLQYSVQEGFCNAVLEAQAMGLLCVVSDAEGLSENVLDGYSGWVVPKRQPEQLANKLIEVIGLSNSTKHIISRQAHQRVLDQFNLNSQIEAFANFYTN